MSLHDVEVGTELPALTLRYTREDLIRYAGASGDFNPIHWSDRAAAALGLPSVLAHGMLTMGRALRIVTDWAGDPGRVVGYFVRFTRPVRVPDTAEGATVEKGAPLLILEAMKMEHTITAPAAGTVKAFRFGVGDQVGDGAELVEFEVAAA